MSVVWVLAAIGIAHGFGGAPAFTEVNKFSSQLDCEVNKAMFEESSKGVRFSCTRVFENVIIQTIPAVDVKVGDMMLGDGGIRSVVGVKRNDKTKFIIISYIHISKGQVLNFSTKFSNEIKVVR